MAKIKARKVYFIKLGREGGWEEESLQSGIIRFGYKETPHNLCIAGKWDEVRKFWSERRGNRGVGTRDATQIRIFYEADDRDIFITFCHGSLYWCRPTGPIELTDSGERKRKTLDGWHSKSQGGTPFTMDRISGRVQKVQMYQGTICEVRDSKYLLRKINDELPLEIIVAEEVTHKLLNAIVGLLPLLDWEDFEILVGLIFSSSGWKRLSRDSGGNQKTIDFEFLLPTTNARAFIQVKSQAKSGDLKKYADHVKNSEIYDLMFFVWHSGNIGNEISDEKIVLIGPEKLARMILDAGLLSWLQEKVS